jgi:hypothetical protein
MPTLGYPTGAHPTPDYTDQGDGTVLDNTTCLTWQRQRGPATYSWSEAQAYCASLGTGWRLPTRIEMTSVMNHARNPSVDATAFPDIGADGYYFSGSAWGESIFLPTARQLTWIFGLNNGFTSNAGERETAANNAWCVTGNGAGEGYLDLAVAPPNHYTVTGGEVTDNYTGLVWQQSMSETKLAWTNITAYCASLTLNGHGGWRVPALQELASLVDEAVVAPAIDRVAFPGTPSHNSRTDGEDKDWFWAGNPVRNDASRGWGLNFMDGFTGEQNATEFRTDGTVNWNYWTTAWVKCVR